jgi:trehalose 6-phosphate phosphatase
LNGTQTEKLEDFFRSVAESESPLLLLDYDGTLADFRVNRFDARPWAGVRELLARIQSDNRTQLILVTGRPAGEINPILKLDLPVEVWGLHGAERLLANGRRELDEAPPEVLKKLDELREQLRKDAFGGLIEDKPNAIVMHWRGKSPQQAKQIEAKTRAVFEAAAEVKGFSLLPFESGIELRVGRDKGGAVEAILKLSKPGSPVTYVGDDLTDENAFRAVNAADGPHLSVLMRRMPRETAADVWLKPPEDLRWFLRRWLLATTGAESHSVAVHTGADSARI